MNEIGPLVCGCRRHAVRWSLALDSATTGTRAVLTCAATGSGRRKPLPLNSRFAHLLTCAGRLQHELHRRRRVQFIQVWPDIE